MALYVSLLAGALLLGGAAFALTVRARRRGNLLAGAALALVCGKAALHAMPHWEWALFPWPGYAYLQGFVLYPIASLFFGTAAGHLPVRWNRAAVALVGLLVLAHGARENAWIAWPETHGCQQTVDATGHIEQSTPYTCGPCACASAVHYFGVRISERGMARYCLTRRTGSRLYSLYRGVQLALDGTDYNAAIRDLEPPDLLVKGSVAVVSNAAGRHAVCIRGEGHRVKVHDPLLPEPYYQGPDELAKSYSGPAVVIERRR